MPSTMDQMVEAGARAFLKEYGDPTAEWFDYRVDIEAALRAALPILGHELAMAALSVHRPPRVPGGNWSGDYRDGCSAAANRAERAVHARLSEIMEGK